METIDLGSFSMEDDAPKQIVTKQHVIAMPKTKSLQKAIMDIPKVNLNTTTSVQPSKVSNNTVKEHQDYILMISRYGTSPRFADYLKSLTFKLDIPSLKKLSFSELEDVLQRVRTSIANRTVNDIWSSTIFGAISVSENIAEATSLSEYVHLKGLSSALKEDEGFLDLLEELKLANQNLAYVGIESRLLYTVLTTTLRVHSLNNLMYKHKQKNKVVEINNAPQEPPSEQKEEHVIDLSD
jgi:hypothetical protein